MQYRVDVMEDSLDSQRQDGKSNSTFGSRGSAMGWWHWEEKGATVGRTYFIE